MRLVVGDGHDLGLGLGAEDCEVLAESGHAYIVAVIELGDHALGAVEGAASSAWRTAVSDPFRRLVPWPEGRGTCSSRTSVRTSRR